jgi:hypothetical protein
MSDKKRTITLTGRPPVSIVEAAWPVIAHAKGDSCDDASRYQQMECQDELDRYYLTARQHNDGRTLVYGVLITRGFTASPQPDYRGGVLLPEGMDVASALANVGSECGLPASLIREAIADLPAEEL